MVGAVVVVVVVVVVVDAAIVVVVELAVVGTSVEPEGMAVVMAVVVVLAKVVVVLTDVPVSLLVALSWLRVPKVTVEAMGVELGTLGTLVVSVVIGVVICVSLAAGVVALADAVVALAVVTGTGTGGLVGGRASRTYHIQRSSLILCMHSAQPYQIANVDSVGSLG